MAIFNGLITSFEYFVKLAGAQLPPDVYQNMAKDFKEEKLHLSTIDDINEYIDTVADITESIQAHYIIDQYALDSSLIMHHCNTQSQQEVLNRVKEKLIELAPQLSINEKILARGFAQHVLNLNLQNNKQEVGSFLDLFSAHNFQQIFDGMVHAISEHFEELDINTLSNYFIGAIAQNALDIGLCALIPSAYLTYSFTRSLIGTYYYSTNLIGDGLILADALHKKDMHAFGKALVQTSEDLYYAFTCSKGLKDATTGLIHTAKKSTRGGGSEAERYKKPVVQNKDGIFKLEFGKKLKNNSIKTNKTFQNEPIYRVTKKIKGTPIRKGDHFYLDKKHKDHLEIFDNVGNLRSVLNLDGTVNENKYKLAHKNGRHIRNRLK